MALLEPLLDISILIAILIVLITGRKIRKISLREFYIRRKEIEHLYQTLEYMSSILNAPPLQKMFLKLFIRKSPLEENKAPSNYETLKAFKESSYESYLKLRKKINEDIKILEEQPRLRDELKKTRDEIDGIYSLIDTLDEDSSVEYVEDIMKNVEISMMKLSNNLRFDP